MATEVVLITGGSGFLGQHLVRELQEHDESVDEIRIVDLIPYKNNLGHKETKLIKCFNGNIENKASIKEAFRGVSCVIHCAAYVSYQFPPDEDALYKTNVVGTNNVIELCIELCIPKLIFTSTTEVTFTSYARLPVSLLAIVVNQTEAKVKTPQDISELLIPGYPASKLKAEQIVLAADNSDLKNGGKLRTTALRPTLMYGEEDNRLIPFIMRIADTFDGKIFQLAGVGGKHQLSYAGNVAWAHICAKKTLQDDPLKISGLPIFINDDTPIRDITKFSLGLINNPGDRNKQYCLTWWYIPFIISFFIATLLELLIKLFYPNFITKRVPVSPKAAISYLGSILFYSRLRASIHLQYCPLYTYKESKMKSLTFYTSEKLKNNIKPTKTTQRYILF